jgi:hypothetical protein
MVLPSHGVGVVLLVPLIGAGGRGEVHADGA